MTQSAEIKKLELELQELRAESKKLSKSLHAVTTSYGAVVKKHAQTTERALTLAKGAKLSLVQSNGGAMHQIPVVLVLVDGTSHKFLGELLQKEGGGGVRTAGLLRAAVSEDIAARHPDIVESDYCLVVRIFACLDDLSKGAATSKLIAGRFRSLTSFFAGFTKSGAFFDFVNTESAKEVPMKLCQNLKLYIGNDQCKHVFFAGAGSPSYCLTLKPYRSLTKKITVVAGYDTGEELRELGLPVVAFPSLFNIWSVPKVTVSSTNSIPQNAANVESGERRVTENSAQTTPVNLIDIGPHPKNDVFPTNPALLPTSYYHGRVPVNKDKQRTDIQTSRPSPAALQAYKEHTKHQRLCTAFHLHGQCDITECQLSHDTLTPGALHVLRYKALGMQCKKGSMCRDPNCMDGHICQQLQCVRAGGRGSGCGFRKDLHDVDPQVAEWVEADEGVVQGDTTPVQRKMSEGAEVEADGKPVFSAVEELLLST